MIYMFIHEQALDILAATEHVNAAITDVARSSFVSGIKLEEMSNDVFGLSILRRVYTLCGKDV